MRPTLCKIQRGSGCIRPTKKQPVIGLDMNKRNNADDREYQLPRACARLGQLSCHRHFAMAHAFAIGFGTGCQCLVPLPWPDRTGPTTQTIYAGMPDMSYTRRFLAYPEIHEEIANLLHNKDVRWGIENQMNDKR